MVHARRFRWILDLPRPVQAAAVTALLLGGFGPAGAFLVAGLAAAAGVRWALLGPGLAIAACSAAILAAARRPGQPGPTGLASRPPAEAGPRTG